MYPSTPSQLWGLNATRQRTIWVFLVIVAVIALWLTYRPGLWVSDPVELHPSDIADATYLIDPNTASWASLARLPQVGKTKARRLVKYRQMQEKPDTVVYAKLEDLADVKGFGSATLEAIAPYLVFPPDDGETSARQ